jgi:hypothetical protein
MKLLSGILVASVAAQGGRRREKEDDVAEAVEDYGAYGSFGDAAAYGDYGFGDAYGGYGDSYGDSFGSYGDDSYGGGDTDTFGDYSFGDYEAVAAVDDSAFAAADDVVEDAVQGAVAESSAQSTAGRERPIVTSATRGGPTGSTVFAYCRNCYWLKAAECHARPMEFCDQDTSSPFFDTDDYHHRCLAILRLSRHMEIRIWTGCSTIQACSDMWSQNFAGSSPLLHQCKDSRNAARFDHPSQCSFCHKMSNSAGDQSFPDASGELNLSAGAVTLASLFVNPTAGNLATADTIPNAQSWV